MYYKFTYMWWCSVCKSTMYVKADSKDEAYKKFDSQFGYEEVDIKSCEEVTAEEILKGCVVQ